MTNPNTIEIHGEKTIVKLCKFGAEHNMEGCSFTEIVERLLNEYQRAKDLIPKNPKFFSYDFEGEGIQFHKTVDEAKKETEANLDHYRDRVADGYHVDEDGNFHDVCYGVVLGSAAYSVDDVVTKEHHENDDYTKYEIGTEILSLYVEEAYP